MQARPFLGYAVLGGLIGTFFIDFGQDLAVWLACADRAARGGCIGAEDTILNARMVGIALSGFLSILIAATAARRGQATAESSLALIIGIVAVSGLQILKAGVGEAGYPEIGRLVTALYFWATAGFLILTPAMGAVVGWNQRTVFRLYGRMAVALIVAAVGVVGVFVAPVWFGLAAPGWATTGYLHAYAIALTVVLWSVLLGNIWASDPGAKPFLPWAKVTVSLIAAGLCFGYGALVGVGSSSAYAQTASVPWLVAGLGSLLLLAPPLVGGTMAARALLRPARIAQPFAPLTIGTLATAAAAWASIPLGSPQFIQALDPHGALIVMAQSVAAYLLIFVGVAASAPVFRRIEAIWPPAD